MPKEQGLPASAIFEIVARADGKLPASLLMAVYRASEHRRFVLALHGVSSAAVDELLDHVVRQLPLNIPGLTYQDATDRTAMLRVIASTDLIFAATTIFKMQAEALGFEYHDRRVFRGLQTLVRRTPAHDASDISQRAAIGNLFATRFLRRGYSRIENA